MKPWWSLETLTAWFLMVGVWFVLTAACGGALLVQQRELRAQAFAAEQNCERTAESTAGIDGAARALRDAYQVCMDDHTITRPEGWTDPLRQPG